MQLIKLSQYNDLRRLFERILSRPATSAPVKRVFSHSGLLVRPHRARMTDSLLEMLVFLKCNSCLIGDIFLIDTQLKQLCAVSNANLAFHELLYAWFELSI